GNFGHCGEATCRGDRQLLGYDYGERFGQRWSVPGCRQTEIVEPLGYGSVVIHLERALPAPAVQGETGRQIARQETNRWSGIACSSERLPGANAWGECHGAGACEDGRSQLIKGNAQVVPIGVGQRDTGGNITRTVDEIHTSGDGHGGYASGLVRPAD